MDFTIPAQKLGLEVDEYIELIELFLETGIDDLNELEDAIKNKNACVATERSHSLKGASGNLRLTEIYEKTKNIESRSRENDLDDIEEILVEIKQCFNAITDSLEKYHG